MSPLALSLHFLQAQPDSRLLALAREGHEPAFEALVRRYRKDLLAYCRRLQPRSGSAEDALQQTLLQAWKALSAGAEVRDARPWLYRIAHNVSLNQLRVAVAVPQELQEQADGQEVHQLVEQRLQARAALAEMAALPALQRDVFVSTTLDGASHEEVASALGLSSGAIRGLIYRARATLRSAAAALTPNPVLHWAMKRAESRAGGAPAIIEALAGGGGASMAAALAKGGAVLTLAGAVAGTGGMIVAENSNHHRRAETQLGGALARAHSDFRATPIMAAAGELGRRSVPGEASGRSRSGSHLSHGGSRTAVERGRGSGSVGEDHGGSRGAFTTEPSGRSPGGSDGGSPTNSSGGSDGGSRVGTTTSGDGSTGSGSGSSNGSTPTSSGSGDGSSGGGPGPSSGDQLTTAQVTSAGGSGSDGGSTSGSSDSSGSSETTTTSSR